MKTIDRGALNKVAEKYGNDEFDRLRSHAGRLLEEDGQIEAAIEAYVSAENHEDRFVPCMPVAKP